MYILQVIGFLEGAPSSEGGQELSSNACWEYLISQPTTGIHTYASPKQ